MSKIFPTNIAQTNNGYLSAPVSNSEGYRKKFRVAQVGEAVVILPHKGYEYINENELKKVFSSAFGEETKESVEPERKNYILDTDDYSDYVTKFVSLTKDQFDFFQWLVDEELIDSSYKLTSIEQISFEEI